MLPNDELDDSYASPFYSPNEYLDTERLRPFRTIWTRPRETIRKIVATNPELHVVLLVCLSGIGHGLDRASLRSMGDRVPTAMILGMMCVLGPGMSLIGLWVSSHLIRWTGTWIGGTASRPHIKTAIAWGSAPAALAALLWIPYILLFGSDMFTEEMPRLETYPMLVIPLIALGCCEIVLGIWGAVLFCNTIAEVQGFRSAWAGVGNLFLAFVVPGIALAGLVLIARG